MKKLALLFMALFCVSAFPQTEKQDELNTAIREASNYLNDRIPKGNKIVILNIQSKSPELSDYILDGLIGNAVDDGVFTVVDRSQIDAIESEQQFQMSGAVADDDALEIGRMLSAQTIVLGVVSNIGTEYSLRIRALNVQTSQVHGQFNRNITLSKILNSLIGSGGSVTVVQDAQEAIPEQSKQPSHHSRRLDRRIRIELGSMISPFGYSQKRFTNGSDSIGTFIGRRYMSGRSDSKYLKPNETYEVSRRGWGAGMHECIVDLIYFEFFGDIWMAGDGVDAFQVVGIIFKFPVGNEYFLWYPLSGFGGVGEANGTIFGSRFYVGINEISYLHSELLTVFSNGGDIGFSLKIGGGLDVGLGELKKTYLRTELMYNVAWSSDDDNYETKIKSEQLIHNFYLHVGIGFKWGGKKKPK